MDTKALEAIPLDVRRKALREALKQIPKDKAKVVLADCGLTEEEQRSLLEYNDGADLQWISTHLYTSDRTVDRRRASGLEKLRIALE